LQKRPFSQASIGPKFTGQVSRNCLCFFDPKIQIELELKASLELDLRGALVNQHLRLVFQPQFDKTKRVTGAEVLMRWCDPKRGMVSPAEFIPIAEACGAIVPMGRWILEAACLQLGKWNAQSGWEKFNVSVNVSPRQFREPDFVSNVLEIVTNSGINPGNLMLEITESGVLEDVDASIAKMNQLRRTGITFSMDDFGTGNSSLSNLKRLPLTELKIDQSFVRDIGVDPSDEIIVKTIIAMGQSLGLHVIAEGVETNVQEEMLRKHGCANFQGYLFGRPMPADAFETAFLLPHM
jgi:EAL domain-containing protein (putative c-di-GMP-specific phosphodiesterase class I)